MRPPLCGTSSTRVGSASRCRVCIIGRNVLTPPSVHQKKIEKISAPAGARAGRLLNSQETRKPLSSVSTKPVLIATEKTSAVESRLLPVLGFVFSATSSWPESLVAVLVRRAIHVFCRRSLFAATSNVCAPRPSTPSLLRRAATPPTQACSVTRHLSVLGHNRESGGGGRRLCGRDCMVSDVCRENGK